MQFARNRTLVGLSLTILTGITAACDTPNDPPSQNLSQESASFAGAAYFASSAAPAALEFESGARLRLRVGNVVQLVSTSSVADTQLVSLRIDAVTNVVMLDRATGEYRSVPSVLRVGVLSEESFDAARLSGESMSLVVNESRIEPMRMATTGETMRSIADLNSDGRPDATFTFDASGAGTLPNFNKIEVTGVLAGFGNYRGLLEHLRNGEVHNEWSSSDPAVVTVDASGLASATAVGTATVRFRHAEGVDSATVIVRARGERDQNPLAGIDATGATDVTQALIAYLASVPDGSVISFPEGARYRIEGVILLENRRNLTFEGNGATFFARTDGRSIVPPNREYGHAWPRKRAQFVFQGGGGIVLRDFTIQGAHPNGGEAGDYVAEFEGQHGLTFLGVEGAEVDNVRISDVYGDFLYLGGYQGEWSKNIHVHDSRFERNGRQGIAITGAQDVLIENSYLGNIRRTAVDVEPNGDNGGTRRLTLRNNTFGPIRLTFFAGHGRQGYVDNVTIKGNRLLASGLKILTDTTANRAHRNWRIVGNVSEASIGSPVSPIRLWHMEGVVIRDNVQRMNPARRMTGIQLSASCGVNVVGNQFDGSVADYVINDARGCGDNVGEQGAAPTDDAAY